MPDWIRATHLLNVLFLSFLIRSGLEILSSHPKLYWNDHCTPGTDWMRLTRKQMPEGRLWTSTDEEEAFPAWLALPGGRRLGLGRHWHFATVLGWIVTGCAYAVLLFATPEWRRLVPTSWSIFPDAWQVFTQYASFEVAQSGDPYNALQQLAYFTIVFVLAPLTIATGAAMSPAVIGRFPRFARLFHGKQGARSVHFICLVGFLAFTFVHTLMVVVHGLPEELAIVLLGSREESHSLATVVGVSALAALVAAHWAANVISARRPRLLQRVTGAFLDPLQRMLARRLASRQRYREDEISPCFRVNGYPPRDAAYVEAATHGFGSWRLDVTGLVEQPVRLSLSDLKRLPSQTQVTKHNCIQGWTAVAEWRGVPVNELLRLCRPLASARYLVFWALDDKARTATEGEHGTGEFYETLDLVLARHPQTMLAYEMNGAPLPIAHGAPLRLRVEVDLGFKMVKWIRAIELVDDFGQIGHGQGGWREDHAFYGNAAAI